MCINFFMHVCIFKMWIHMWHMCPCLVHYFLLRVIQLAVRVTWRESFTGVAQRNNSQPHNGNSLLLICLMSQNHDTKARIGQYDIQTHWKLHSVFGFRLQNHSFSTKAIGSPSIKALYRQSITNMGPESTRRSRPRVTNLKTICVLLFRHVNHE